MYNMNMENCKKKKKIEIDLYQPKTYFSVNMSLELVLWRAATYIQLSVFEDIGSLHIISKEEGILS